MYEKIRRNGRVVSMAVLVVTGLAADGTRDILAVEPMFQESEQTYTAVFEGLKARGVETVWLAVSDAHRGIQAAVKKCFLGCSWQRCKVGLLKKSTFYRVPPSWVTKSEISTTEQLYKIGYRILYYAAFATLFRFIVVAVRKLCIVTFSIPRRIAHCKPWRHFASAFTPSTIHLCRAYNQ